MLDQGFNFRKILAWFVVALVSLFVLIWLYNYLTTGQVTITTSSSKSFVKIEGVLGDKNGKYSLQAQHKLQVRVRAGRYEISVRDKHSSNAYSRIITVKARQKLSFNLSLGKVVSAEPVYGKEAAGIVADSSRLLFIDVSSSSLEAVDSTNILTTLSPDIGFVSAKWASTSLGIVESSDNKLYLVNNNVVTPLRLPFTVTSDRDSQNISYDVSKDGHIYLAFEGRVYSGDGSGAFSRIYSGGSGLVVSAGINKVAVLEKAPAAPGDENGLAGRQPVGHLTVLGSNKATLSMPGMNSAAWSPDGKYLLVSGRSGTTVFDDRLHVVGNIYVNNADLYAWLNGSSILYSLNDASNQLWSYDLNTRASSEIASLLPGQRIMSIYAARDGSYAYLSTNNGDATKLYRVALKSQAANSYLGTLGIFLPANVGVCYVNYINFTKPVITVQYPSITSTPDTCITYAKGELAYYGLDINRFQFQAVAIGVGD